jgi:hypothetical protein
MGSPCPDKSGFAITYKWSGTRLFTLEAFSFIINSENTRIIKEQQRREFTEYQPVA